MLFSGSRVIFPLDKFKCLSLLRPVLHTQSLGSINLPSLLNSNSFATRLTSIVNSAGQEEVATQNIDDAI